MRAIVMLSLFLYNYGFANPVLPLKTQNTAHTTALSWLLSLLLLVSYVGLLLWKRNYKKISKTHSQVEQIPLNAKTTAYVVNIGRQQYLVIDNQQTLLMQAITEANHAAI